jgi:hypothetical protein
MNKKPTHFHIFKLVGVVGVITAVVGIALAISGFGDFETNNFMIGGFMTTFGIMMGGIGLMIGFAPEISKKRFQTLRYIQEENKDDLTAIANNTAEIMSDAVTATAEAVEEGMRATKFCKHCGKKIDLDSKFCPECGGEQ